VGVTAGAGPEETVGVGLGVPVAVGDPVRPQPATKITPANDFSRSEINAALRNLVDCAR
jgi:hypothetical protein